jgi:hypothetical protein
MTVHAILIPQQIAAQNIDSLTRSAYATATNFDNGNVCKLTTHGAASGQAEVWTAVAPSTGAGLTDIWMAYSPELVWTGSYRGLDPDVRNFYNAYPRVFDVFSPQVHDIFLLTGNGIATGTGVGAAFINCTDASGVKLEWAASSPGTCFAAKLIATQYISLAGGTLGETQRVTAYQFEVVHL